MKFIVDINIGNGLTRFVKWPHYQIDRKPHNREHLSMIGIIHWDYFSEWVLSYTIVVHENDRKW